MLDEGPCGPKVLANKFKCKESLLTAVETRIWEILKMETLKDKQMPNRDPKSKKGPYKDPGP